MPHVSDAAANVIPAHSPQRAGAFSQIKRATSGTLWPFVLVLAVPVALYVVNPAWLYTPPGWLDSWVPVGLGLNFTDPTVGNTEYKISRLPWNLVQFIVRHSLRENLALVVLQFSFISASVASAARIGRRVLQPPGRYVLMLMTAAFPIIVAATFRGGSDYQNAMAFPLFMATVAALSGVTPGNVRRLAPWAGVTMALLVCVDILYLQVIPYVALFTTAVVWSRGGGRRDLWSILKWMAAGGGACYLGLMLIHAAVGRGFFFFLPEWRFVLSMLRNPARDVWWEPLTAANIRNSPHLIFVFVWGGIALVEFVWLAALDTRADARRLQLAIHGGFLIELAIWTAWQVFGHHTALLPVYLANPLFGPACISVAAVVSRHLGAMDRRIARAAAVLLPLACVMAIVDSRALLAPVQARIAPPFPVSAVMMVLSYIAMLLVRAVRTQPGGLHPLLAGSVSVCAVLLLPLTFASTAPDYLYAPTPCRLYPHLNRFLIESSQYLLRQTPHAPSVFVWASPDDRMPVSATCRPFWTGQVEEVAGSFVALSHTYLSAWKPHMARAADVPLDRLRLIGADPESVVAVVSSDRTFADAMRLRFETAGVTMDEVGELRADGTAELPSIYLLVPVDARLAAGIRAQLRTDPTTASSDIDLAVGHRVVRLWGLADSEAARQRAFTLARTFKGVTDVMNEVQIRGQVIREIKGALAADPLVGRIPIDVQSIHATIVLVSDKTNQEQRTRALQVARAAAGVVPVEDHMK